MPFCFVSKLDGTHLRPVTIYLDLGGVICYMDIGRYPFVLIGF